MINLMIYFSLQLTRYLQKAVMLGLLLHDLTVNDIPIQFKVNIDADVTALPPKEFLKFKELL